MTDERAHVPVHAALRTTRNMETNTPAAYSLHSVCGQSQTFQILIKHIGKTINNYEIKYMQYENILYDNSNDGYFIL
jgi:hypothetical protein